MFCVSLNTKQVVSETFFPFSWRSTETLGWIDPRQLTVDHNRGIFTCRVSFCDSANNIKTLRDRLNVNRLIVTVLFLADFYQ